MNQEKSNVPGLNEDLFSTVCSTSGRRSTNAGSEGLEGMVRAERHTAKVARRTERILLTRVDIHGGIIRRGRMTTPTSATSPSPAGAKVQGSDVLRLATGGVDRVGVSWVRASCLADGAYAGGVGAGEVSLAAEGGGREALRTGGGEGDVVSLERRVGQGVCGMGGRGVGGAGEICGEGGSGRARVVAVVVGGGEMGCVGQEPPVPVPVSVSSVPGSIYTPVRSHTPQPPRRRPRPRHQRQRRRRHRRHRPAPRVLPLSSSSKKPSFSIRAPHHRRHAPIHSSRHLVFRSRRRRRQFVKKNRSTTCSRCMRTRTCTFHIHI